MKLKSALVFIACMCIPSRAFAVLPPDIIFSVGTQLWQIVVGIGALLLGSFTAIFPFLKNLFSVPTRMRVVLLSLGLCIFFGGVGYLIYVSAFPPLPASNVAMETASSTHHEFHSNRFVFLGNRSDGQPVLVNMDINRKELADGSGYVHYYFGNIVYGTTSFQFSEERNSPTREVLPDLFFTSFVRTLPPDHSAREAYTLSFQSGGLQFQFATEMITSEFLIKNEPEYSAYIGAGKATGVVDGETIVFHAMVERIYSTDYRPTVFFDPEGKLRSESVQLVLWDEAGNFTLVDESRVGAYSPAYASHFWGLGRTPEGVLRRYFDGVSTFSTLNSAPHFQTTMGTTSAAQTIDLSLTQPFLWLPDEGYVDGTITDQLGVRYIHGLGYHHIYGPK